MNETGRAILFYAFALSVLVVIGVYFIGLSTDAGAFATSARALIYSLTGRDSSGQFANYPGGASPTNANLQGAATGTSLAGL